ncbi:hypothetical protein [Pantoea sp. 1.19]|uniref:hypothetical protein n=1 Tax=Pantoea sp. 1.19 TaxID=1925589 RepID=UPI001F0A3239|nr:hypothetical protein [Pantoea sp. 1.19]
MPGGARRQRYAGGTSWWREAIAGEWHHAARVSVPGIGLRFSRSGDTVNLVYPGSYSSRAGSLFATDYTLEGSRFTLEIVKTAPVTGSVASDQYTSYDYQYGHNPILETWLSASALTIVSPSVACRAAATGGLPSRRLAASGCRASAAALAIRPSPCSCFVKVGSAWPERPTLI